MEKTKVGQNEKLSFLSKKEARELSQKILSLLEASKEKPLVSVDVSSLSIATIYSVQLAITACNYKTMVFHNSKTENSVIYVQTDCLP